MADERQKNGRRAEERRRKRKAAEEKMGETVNQAKTRNEKGEGHKLEGETLTKSQEWAKAHVTGY